ncbi:OmpP1/FadL family transporter [Riemerella anatipestifer]|uniref:OmpP1/FadL family transporter n=1 Tax=Riemerella anatipestifer TaxID=34085 RepID=UPI0021F8D36F|nr:outer membrane protein transport protein [Riemerella anatipestifer]MCW0516531.1 outer membrane protein transport protein [Riemerella anatipestifer]
MKKIILTSAVLCGVLAQAGGFRVSLQGVKQLAMAHTSAHAEDASVAFFNPAGISFIPSKLSVVAGGFGALSSVTYQDLNTLNSYTTDNPLGTPFYAAVAYKVTDDVSLGLSVTTPFGSTVQWGEDWAGKEMVQKMELKSFFFQPMVSVKLANWVSLGASYIYAKGSVNWDKAVTSVNGTMNIKDEKASGQGFSFGFYFKPDEKWDVSVAYRSPVDMKANSGKVSFNMPKSLYTLKELDANGQDNFKATLPLVDEYTIGATYKITPKWLVSADFNYTGWSEYSHLALDFENAKLGNQPNDATLLVTPKNFKNTQTWRFGTQYMVTDKIAARLGYYYDESPYTDRDFIPETPSFNSSVVTAGLGFKLNKVGIDLAGAMAFPQARTVANDYYSFYGQAKAKAVYFGLGLSYNPF